MKKKIKKITEAEITHVSFVPKGANGQNFLIVKDGDDTNMKFEVPILKIDKEQRLVTGVVYAPNVVDSQGEFMEEEAIEKTAHDFMAYYRNIDAKHSFEANKNVAVVESFVTKGDMTLEGQCIKKGTWLLTTKVYDDTIWENIKKGKLRSYSMGGTGTREEVREEDVKLFTKEKNEIPERGEREESMKKEDMEKVLKEVIMPLGARLAALEKEEKANNESNHVAKESEILTAIVKEAMEPMVERLERIEKARGLSRQLNVGTVEKSNGAYFTNIQI